MCGIAGEFGCATQLRPEILGRESRAVLAHRGPDSFGCWQENGVSLLHWRLAIIDLSAAGNQPMLSADQRFVLCYNGEVYNFQQLRAEVEMQWQRHRPGQHQLASATARSIRWRGHSDTEVIVEGFALWGKDFLSRLNGMFALALFDRQTRTLYLTRDRAGIKPLYLWERNGSVLFASEAKFFFHTKCFDPAIDARGLTAFFTYGHCYGENHTLGGVSQLEPGQVLTLQVPEPAGSPRVVSITRSCPRPQWRPLPRDDASSAEQLRTVLSSAVARQLVADVPVGVLLSGGVDSSILTALTARLIGPEKTMAFTLGYPGMGPDYDEIKHARRVAKHLGVQHYVYEASQTDLIRDLEQLVWHYDEPFSDAASLNVFLISRMIRSRVTVALAGEGSDELFGGYRRYHFERVIRGLGSFGRSLCRTFHATRLDRIGWIPRRFQVLLRAMAQKSAAARYSSYLESEIPISMILKPEWQRKIGVDAFIEKGYPDELDSGVVSRLCLIDQQFWLPGTYLEKSDKGGMAHSLEIRVPFLDNEVVEFANTLPDDQRIRGSSRKWLLKMAFKDLVPGEVFTRFKRGFAVPVSRWLRNELREFYLDHVFSPAARVKPYLQMDNVEALFRGHLRGAHDYSSLLWQCLILEIWLRHFERRFRKPNSGGSFIDNALVNQEIRQANQASVRESLVSRAAGCCSDTAQNY